MAKDMELVGVRLSKPMLNHVDTLVKSGLYPSRSEVLRDAFRKIYMQQLKEELHQFSRKNREEWHHELMARAGGNEEKAFKLWEADLAAARKRMPSHLKN